MTFPPTKFRPGEGLYSALVRPMEEDLGLPSGSYFPEEELDMIPNDGKSIRYAGLPKKWYLYPVDISLTEDALSTLAEPSDNAVWWTLDEVLNNVQEPNVRAIANQLREHRPDLVQEVRSGPSMDALACHWAARNEGGVRLVRHQDISRIMDVGSRAFNLRVADPYLPYQKQGLGFTWSFFGPKDKQDVHVHGLPAVEIYGVFEGRLQVWHKPMNQRGVRTWRAETLEAGDWLEVEPLHCHFACWLEPQGLGTVIKAAASGELAGVGKLGVSGKTVCKDCPVETQCQLHPTMEKLLEAHQEPYDKRDYKKIAALAKEAEGF
ncbi:MAG: hypothetical protein SWQ30_19805 [Thermodesulfobacteriota bacterium]|nr:hypothetical protein [Thermodesulfobacteriota bacterium]